MEFSFETRYDLPALTVMARALRKTIRKKHSRRSHVLGFLVAVLAVLLTIPQARGTILPPVKVWITWAVAAILVFAMVREDRLNAWFARNRMLPGTEYAETVFCPDGYTSVTAAGTTEWEYENIRMLAETRRYFVFVFSKSHAQIYDKSNLSGGSAEEFRRFITEVTDLEVSQIPENPFEKI